VQGQTNSDSRWFWVPDAAERGRGLPPGVSHIVNTNGNLECIVSEFTTRAYEKEAMRLMALEASQAAQALQLDDDVPITRSRITSARVSPFGSFHVTYPDDTRTNRPVKAQFNKIGTPGD
jgi:hypothetical protein